MSEVEPRVGHDLDDRLDYWLDILIDRYRERSFAPRQPEEWWQLLLSYLREACRHTDDPLDAWHEGLLELAVAALTACDQLAAPATPGHSNDPDVIVALAYWAARDHIKAEKWTTNNPDEWAGNLLILQVRTKRAFQTLEDPLAVQLIAPQLSSIAGGALLAAAATTPPRRLDVELADAAAPQVMYAHERYLQDIEDGYRHWAHGREGHRQWGIPVADDIETALPSGWGHTISDLVPAARRHEHHLSAKSSQTLLLGTFGIAQILDPTLAWLERSFGIRLPGAQLELEVDVRPDLLNEHPRVTQLDALVESDNALFCLEAKWTESHLGTCSCGEAARARGECLPRVRARPTYWEASEACLGLDTTTAPCQLGAAYQAVRVIAAARALAHESKRRAIAGLLYDARNPVFAGTDQWPGWARLLENLAASAHGDVTVVACSWQQLAAELPSDPELERWLGDKHSIREDR